MGLHLAEGAIHTVQTPFAYLGYKKLNGFAKNALRPMPDGDLYCVGHYIDHELVENVENRPAGIREDRLHAHALEPLDDDARARAGLHTGLRGRLGAAGFRFGFVFHCSFPLVWRVKRAAY